MPSILFDHPFDPGSPQAPDFFGDLNLDQVEAAILAGRDEYELAPFFRTPVRDADAVRYRHEVLRDLEDEQLLAAVRSFAGRMQKLRGELTLAEKLYYPLQQQGMLLAASRTYGAAVSDVAVALEAAELRSRGLLGVRDELRRYTASEPFVALAEEGEAIQAALGRIRYTVHIKDSRVTVGRPADEPDLSAEVERTFARFRQGAGRDYRVRLPHTIQADHVEAQILEKVAELHPRPFAELARFCERRGDFLEPTVASFDREAQFYLAYLDHVAPFRARGLPLCYPEISDSKETHADEAYDLALAAKLVPEGGRVVCNGFRLEEPERILVVTGPNQGGKTTFARMFGQLHYLASLGLPVPAREARLVLPDRIFSHFEREEDIATLRGKLEDDLVRLHELLEGATSDSLVVLNESFTSTTLDDAVFIGTEVMRRLIALDCLAVCVTFVDELASLSEETVSMVAAAERTYELFRRPADGLAYAWAIAEKYGLTYERLKERVGS
ncbi:MAG: hypothetical protein WD067_08230 [Gaiellaceae bacterium]